MGSPGSLEDTLEEALEVFTGDTDPGTPLTTSEVADELGCVRRTAFGKLETLAERGALETKKVGARGRVWWRPVGDSENDAGADESSSDATDEAASDGSRESDQDGGTEQQSLRSGIEEAQFRELAGTVTDYAIFVLDPDGHVQTWNDGAREIKGYDEEEIVGEHFSTFYTDEDRAAGRPDDNLTGALAEGRLEDEGWRVRKDGTRFWANVTITSLHDDGEHLGFVKITRDMTEQHEYEQQLRTEKERFEALVREVEDYAIFLLDEDGIVQTWNEGARQLKGYEDDEIVGEHFSAFYTEDDREADRPEHNLATATKDGRIEDEGWRVRNDGSKFWANVVITALHDDDGEIRGYAKVTRDMTERHRYEERLRSQRDELDELNQINAVIRDIDQALVTATSREEIEQAVCDRLAASDTYAGAWTAEYTEGLEAVTPRTWAGIDEEYVEAIRSAGAESGQAVEAGVGATALETGEIQSIQRLRTDGESEPWRAASVDAGYESAITVPLSYNDVDYGVLTVYADDESAFGERKVAVMEELGETISHAIAAIRRKQRERTLTALQESTRELLHTETREEIGDLIVETLTDDLALAEALVYYFDTSENALEPVSSSLPVDVDASRLTPLTAGSDSPVWTSFVEAETTVTDDAPPASGVGTQRTMLVPLGDHGVLSVAAAEQETFDPDSRNLVELVAATAEAAFDRVESQANLRERDELLQEQNQRLQRVNQINTIIREVDQGLVQATTREEVQRIVCDQLTTSDRFRFAWIGAPDDADDGLAPQAWSGNPRGYLDSVDLTDRDGVDAAEPSIVAARSGDVAVVSNVAENLRAGQWRKEAFSREFQSIVGVPLTYGDVSYGVLTVYADRPEAFEEMERSVFAELGETIANAINAVDTKQALLEEDAVELEFRLQNESASFLARLATQADCEVTLEGTIPLSEDRVRVFFVARDASAEALCDRLDQSIAVESLQVIATSDEGHLLEAVVSGPTVATVLHERGASLRSLTATPDDARLVAEVPSSEDVSGFVDHLQTRYEGAEFVARRERERPVQSPAGLYAELESALTDRQREVLETAYYSGFFESPRRSTGGDVADLLDVSQPTVTEQLRTAQRKLLDLLFAERADGE